jgi:iron complex transport system substrate-binding protein
MVPVLFALFAAGCGGSEEERDSGGETGVAVTSGGGTFPAEATHQFGTTVVEEEPERIVVVGLSEQDTVLALGYKPVAVTEWFGEQPGAIWPWAREAMGPEDPVVLDNSDGIPFEEIAALKPDLIIGTAAGLERGDYDKLSAIAPTVAGVVGGTDYFSPWDQQTELIAEALGEKERGEEIVTDIEAEYAAVAEEHPEWGGKTATFSQCGFYDGLAYVYPPGLGTEFLTYLGFEINPKLEPLVEVEGEQVTVSTERLDVLEADTIVFACDEPGSVPKLSKVPTFETLPAVAEGRSVYTDPVLAAAIYFNSPLSLPYVLEHLTPELAKAVKGEAPQRQMPDPPEEAEVAAAPSADEAVFPATVAHKWGTTTIEAAPERVVVAGLREQDALLALGVVPVATTEWFGEKPGAVFPWAEDELGDAPLPEVLSITDGIEFEKIAALRPDLIVAVYSEVSKEDYAKLTAIAPTIAQPKGQINWGASWQDELVAVGDAVGKPEEADRLLAATEGEIADATAANPEFKGASGAMATSYEGLYVWGPEDPRTKMLQDLGFTFPAALNDIGGEEFGGIVPDEQASELDLDAVVWFAEPPQVKEIERHPVYGKLDVHKEGRDVFIPETGPVADEATYISVLSIPTLLDGLVPRLAAAVDGDPATPTTIE